MVQLERQPAAVEGAFEALERSLPRPEHTPGGERSAGGLAKALASFDHHVERDHAWHHRLRPQALAQALWVTQAILKADDQRPWAQHLSQLRGRPSGLPALHAHQAHVHLAQGADICFHTDFISVALSVQIDGFELPSELSQPGSPDQRHVGARRRQAQPKVGPHGARAEHPDL